MYALLPNLLPDPLPVVPALPVGVPSAARMSSKARGKRPMTAAQLEHEYAKMPKAKRGYDSDDDPPVRCSTPMHIRHARAAAVSTLGDLPSLPAPGPDAVSHTVTFAGARLSPTNPYEEAWAQDIIEALEVQRDLNTVAGNTIQSLRRARRASNVALFGDSDGPDGPDSDDSGDLYHDNRSNRDPSRVVADPFDPEATCTLAEHNAILQDEQEYRRKQGLAALVQNPCDPYHWMDPQVLYNSDQQRFQTTCPTLLLPLEAVPVLDGLLMDGCDNVCVKVEDPPILAVQLLSSVPSSGETIDPNQTP